ncbi:PQ-loop domain-containing transporter [Wolbachia endosymbiont of Oedothorax gibbosus]|uniref:PQ-loop domain-containing transporter n=1 Tax=Wolbachia endosymbiont of Oedothorax gibbosus TaxID=931100 RepID=UPI0020249CB5|nr:PQ-loop domain-containing transporter [Wolbachia endosymbiont of Oedothorax gibbosus]
MYINVEKFFGFIGIITTIIGLLPQVYKAYVTKLTHDVSMLMLVSYLICSLSWLGYAVCHGATLGVFCSVAESAVSIISIIQKCYYDAKSTRGNLS